MFGVIKHVKGMDIIFFKKREIKDISIYATGIF